MSNSKYLDSLTKEEYDKLTQKLFNQQKGKCYICRKDMDLDLNITNIDHIIPLVNNGKDEENNFGLTHESCNKSKQDADLRIARTLSRLNVIKEQTPKGETTSLKHVLQYYGGSKYDFKYKINNNIMEYSFSNIGDNNIYKTTVFDDRLSGEKSSFIEVPIEYVFHDELINPRGINSSFKLLVKEFYKGNPQLHISLARIDEGRIKIFDGQHKAVAQLLLGAKRLIVRVFIDPDVDRLIETNTNAGSKLKQIAFDKSIVRQLHNTLYMEKLEQYQSDHGLKSDDFNFSEKDVVEHFKGERGNIRQYIINSIKNQVTHNSKLTDYIDFDGRGKELPISYSTFEKTFLALFINSKTILSTNINYKEDEGLNPRILERNQLIKLCDILAEEIYEKKFDVNVGVNRIEQRLINGRDKDITDDHLVAYRVSKEEILANWLKYVEKVIKAFFINAGKSFNEENLFQQLFEEQLWENIRIFIKNFIQLPLWKNRELASTIFSGKSNYNYWKCIFETGKTVDGVQVLAQPINYMDMIKK